ncbi:MAG: sugar transferase [Verrucomicrobia bacterium]|nr:sugar transferase [Verrucomicrobiota bacterium]
MLRRKQQFRAQVHQWRDAFLFAFSLWLTHALWAPWHPVFFNTHEIQPFSEFAWLFLVIIPGAPLALEAVRFYQRPMHANRRDTYYMLAQGCFLATLALIVVIFLFKMQLARIVIGLYGWVSFFVMMISEEVSRGIYRSRYGKARIQRRFILVGTPSDIQQLNKDLNWAELEGVEILAEMDLHQGGVKRLVQELHEKAPNGVVLAGKHTYFGEIEAAIQACELEGVEVWLLADFFQPQISQTNLDELQGRPVLVFRSAPADSWPRLVKSAMDTVCAGIALVVLSPVLVSVAIAIKRTSKGPVLFRQARCGLNGQPFMMYKFRSMVTDAEQRKDELAKFNEMDGPVFKITDDPRITPIGKWLRKFSVDELPQLYNVLKGDMSIVGPRPLPVDEVRRFDDVAHRRRLSVKPGLTCLWQIQGRSNVTNFKEWVRLDLEYIDNWSLWLDLKIIFMTVPVVLRGSGAK